jgi:hypothetical protein
LWFRVARSYAQLLYLRQRSITKAQWMKHVKEKRQIARINWFNEKTIVCSCDHQGDIQHRKNAVLHLKSQHMHMFTIWISCVGKVRFNRYHNTSKQVVDIFTKYLRKDKFNQFKAMLTMKEKQFIKEEEQYKC